MAAGQVWNAYQPKLDLASGRSLGVEALVHELGMKVVAEGVEDSDCLARLAEMGCDTAQGWHIDRSMPAAALSLSLFLSERLLRAA